MSLVTRLLAARGRAILGGAALSVGLIAAPGAWAQCTDNFNFVAANVPSPDQFAPVSVLAPLGAGSSLNALTSMINTVNTAFLTTTTAFVSAPGNPQPDQQGGGAWSRVIAGTVDTKSDSTGTVNLSSLGLQATGTQNCHTVTRQDYWGYQAGRDISILNGGGTGANWHFGVTAGYFEAKTKDLTSAGSYTNANFPGTVLNTPAGSLVADTEIPFAGIYTAFTKGGFFLDAQTRFDFFQNSLTDPNNGLAGQSLNATGVSLTANVGYNVSLGSNWFIEPSGGVVWSRVSVDPLNVSGVLQTGAPFFPYARGTVVVEDIDSVLGRASVRIGTNFTSGGVAWQPFFTASVFHEFDGDVTATSTVSGTITPATPTSAIEGIALTSHSEGGVGTYGQFALGTAAAILNTGWLGYARVDYRVGDEIEGWSVNAGLRYQFTPDPAPAGSRGGPQSAAWRDYNWTGFYLGGSGGGLWGHEDWTFTNAAGVPTGGPGVDPHFQGYLLGGQVGYNHQFGKWVVGVEADYAGSNAEGGKACPNAFFFTCGAEVDQLGSVAGRLGYAWGRALLYGKVGWATAEVSAAPSQNTANPNTGTPLATPITSSNRLDGVTFGAGVEFALSERWSAKAEWMHFDFGSDLYQVSNTPEFADVSASGDALRIGVNLHFNPARRD
jgi:hypothetical protein